MTAAALPAWLAGAVTSCRLCDAQLHKVADPVQDLYVWAGPDGRQWGPDPDVAQLQPNPYAYLTALGARILAGDHSRAGEYSALKVRLDLGGTSHQHWACGAGPARPGRLAEHCGWPGLLRPSGWECRQCGAQLPDPVTGGR